MVTSHPGATAGRAADYDATVAALVTTGAARQRGVHARTGDINTVLADSARQTIEQ
jgi:hypothetical protein